MGMIKNNSYWICIYIKALW